MSKRTKSKWIKQGIAFSPDIFKWLEVEAGKRAWTISAYVRWLCQRAQAGD